MDKFVIRKRKTSDEIRDNAKHRKTTDNCISDVDIKSFVRKDLTFQKISGENLSCDYGVFLSKDGADRLLAECERTLTYNEGQLAKVQIFGKWHDIPRKQVI